MKRKWLLVFFSSLAAIALLIYVAKVLSGLEPADVSLDSMPSAQLEVQQSANQADSQPELNMPIPTSQLLPTSQPSAHIDTTQQPYTDEQARRLVDAQLAELTLEQKIGQLLIIGIEDSGKSVSKETKKLITEQGVGNIILFKRNIASDELLPQFIKELKQLPAVDIPLWITIDQEGGEVNRLSEHYPSAGELAELNDVTITEATGDLIGSRLAQLSIDMNFAPVLDINSNVENPVIGSRAFGDNAQSVISHSTAMLHGLEHHVLTVGKHFPGHGDTSVDSHIQLPTITKSWDELEQLEILPFRAAIENNIDAIMVGHLFVPKLDPVYPASLSETIITYYLREVLSFKGIIITDDLVMGGITEQYELTDAAVKALQAGNTMLIIGHQPKQQQRVREHLIKAVQQGLLDEQLIDEKVRLVLLMKLNKLAYLQ